MIRRVRRRLGDRKDNPMCDMTESEKAIIDNHTDAGMHKERIARLAALCGRSEEWTHDQIFRYDWPNIGEHLLWLRAHETTDEEIVSWLLCLPDEEEDP